MQRIVSKLSRIAIKVYRLLRARILGVELVANNCLFIDRFDQNSTIVDVGCGFDADFSMYMIEKYNLHSFGVDPTKKHADALANLSIQTDGKFKHLEFAIAAETKKLIFHESQENVSGSLLKDHCNILNDSFVTYEVQALSLDTLLSYLNLEQCAYIKLDLEGAEYDLLSKVSPMTLSRFEQIFVEFHHRGVESFSISDTRRLVERVEGFGFSSFTLDTRNYLFFTQFPSSR